MPPLEANTNRLRPFGVQCDAETDSGSDSDSQKHPEHAFQLVSQEREHYSYGMSLIKQYVTNTELLKKMQTFDLQ